MQLEAALGEVAVMKKGNVPPIDLSRVSQGDTSLQQQID